MLALRHQNQNVLSEHPMQRLNYGLQLGTPYITIAQPCLSSMHGVQSHHAPSLEHP